MNESTKEVMLKSFLHIKDKEIETLRQQLAASQIREKQLRESAERVLSFKRGEENQHLVTRLYHQSHTAELDEYVEGNLEQVLVSEPNYHHEAMGCGLEDRNITDRYEAMQYGWDCAVDHMFNQIPDEPLYRIKEKTE